MEYGVLAEPAGTIQTLPRLNMPGIRARVSGG